MAFTGKVKLVGQDGRGFETDVTVATLAVGGKYAAYVVSEEGNTRLSDDFDTAAECDQWIIEGGIGTVVIDDY